VLTFLAELRESFPKFLLADSTSHRARVVNIPQVENHRDSRADDAMATASGVVLELRKTSKGDIYHGVLVLQGEVISLRQLGWKEHMIDQIRGILEGQRVLRGVAHFSGRRRARGVI
jgi:hypothetical protein